MVRKNPTTVVLVLYDNVFSLMNANELAHSFSYVQNGVISLLKEHSHFCVFMVYFLHFYYNAGTLDYLIIAFVWIEIGQDRSHGAHVSRKIMKSQYLLKKTCAEKVNAQWVY